MQMKDNHTWTPTVLPGSACRARRGFMGSLPQDTHFPLASASLLGFARQRGEGPVIHGETVTGDRLGIRAMICLSARLVSRFPGRAMDFVSVWWGSGSQVANRTACLGTGNGMVPRTVAVASELGVAGSREQNNLPSVGRGKISVTRLSCIQGSADARSVSRRYPRVWFGIGPPCRRTGHSGWTSGGECGRVMFTHV